MNEGKKDKVAVYVVEAADLPIMDRFNSSDPFVTVRRLNPKPESRNLKPETRNLKPETRNPIPETRYPKPET